MSLVWYADFRDSVFDDRAKAQLETILKNLKTLGLDKRSSVVQVFDKIQHSTMDDLR